MDGIVHSGEISGLGWDADASVERLSACDNTLAFPPDAPGTYTGDVDWITVDAQETGVLCFSLKTDPSEGGAAAGARLDAVLYDLDECDEPVPCMWKTAPLPRSASTSRSARSSGPSASRPEPWPLWVLRALARRRRADAVLDRHLALVPGVAEAPSALCPEVEG